MKNDVYNPYAELFKRLDRIESMLEGKKNDVLLSPKKVCEMLDITPETLVRWQNGGHIKATYIKKRKYFSQSEIDRIISENTMA